MKTVVLGAAGGLGRNVVDAAARAGHEVSASVRQLRGEPPPAGGRVIEGDAAHFCVNPRLSRWLEDFPPLLAALVRP